MGKKLFSAYSLVEWKIDSLLTYSNTMRSALKLKNDFITAKIQTKRIINDDLIASSKSETEASVCLLKSDNKNLVILIV